MKAYQRQFIEFALNKQVLKFGEFTLKSGRKSPYFFNAGLFNTGRDLALLGRFYAEALVDSGIDFDLLFGAARLGLKIVDNPGRGTPARALVCRSASGTGSAGAAPGSGGPLRIMPRQPTGAAAPRQGPGRGSGGRRPASAR